MYLKSIEIQGFKSFANRIVLEFHNGITGIVGPNGSGKSNIADAVRWVLGEQKVKQLRSTGMQDVIFAGTENRRPVSFAYVAITLDNSDRALGLDYNEVTVARRVYRSGESEYLLNGTACRLRDIHELFYDTGIGKEGYSIIGQGQIDRILSGKPEERRELFDEAAGIVKFKRRKQLTMKKLENEQQNMLRVTDIMNELERQVGPLASQSEKARTYLKKKEDLKACEVNSFLMEMDRVDRESASVQDKYDIAAAQQTEANTEFEAIRIKYEDLETRMETNDARIADLNSQISAIDVEREKSEGRINVLMEQINTIRQGESHVNDRLDELVADIEKREQTGQAYSDEKAETDKQIAEVEQQKNELAHRLEVLQKSEKEAEEQIEAGKQEILALLEARAALEGDQQRCTTIIEQAGIRQAQLNQQMVTDQSTGFDALDQLKEKEAALEELDARILSREKKKISLLAKRRKWQEQTEQLSAELDKIRQQYNRQSSELAALKNIAERYDGYGNGIRKVMERRTDTKGIRGVVADLIHVDKRYETAIEIALGGSIQNIVVDDEDTAKQMIAYLKENRFGRVTFLPLTSVSASDNTPAKKALGETGAIGMADTLVETDNKYRGVAGYLLGRILVVDNIDHAIAIEKKYHYSIRIVTLEGESLMPGGSISGGAFRNKGNLLGRTREIEALEKSLAAMKAREKKAAARLEDVQTAEELVKDDLNDLTAEMTDLGLKQNTLKVEVEHLEEEKARHDALYKDILDEIASLEDQKSESLLDKEQILLQLKNSKQREADITANNERLDKKLTGISAEAARLGEEISEITVTMAQLVQKSDFSRENIQRVAEEILTLHQSQQEVLLNATNSTQEIENREKEIEELKILLTDDAGRRESLAEGLTACMTEKEKMTEDHRDFFDRREYLSQELARLDKEIFRLEDRKEKLEHTRETQTDYMWQEYELTRHEAVKLKDDELPNAGDLKKRIIELKGEIRELGDVNVNAIEEYKSVSERYEFLKGQYEDLQQAEQTLEDIIADLDEGMKKQFSEKFADIQKEFDKTFKELFGGGKGTLELTMDEDHDILDCGIGIIAQPPGKKLVNMMQLSGGEKALTAIALLFAIQNLKPSPFCLLDEIEAALDDPNVVRYAKYLGKLTKNTQFIVITHRRGTMNAADRLYGITMQEKGVSALVSVNLIEKDLEE